MIIYSNTAGNFRDSVDGNVILSEIEEQFSSKLGRRIGAAEKRAWNNSLRFMETVVRRAQVPDDCGILIEYIIPSTSKRVDFIISGRDAHGRANVLIVELKQWEKAFATDRDGVVNTFLSNGYREVVHPSYQAFSYKKYISEMNEAVAKNEIAVWACAYLHNYYRSSPEPLLSDRYEAAIGEAPIFFADQVEKLERFVASHVEMGRGMEIIHTLDNGTIRPSRKLVDSITDIFGGNDVYTLIDEQKVAYETVVSAAANLGSKRTMIVNGGPGTGKSVVAVNALVALLKRRLNVKFVAPNSSFRTVIVESLSKGSVLNREEVDMLFTGSGGFYSAGRDSFDVLIVDEAHRLKGKGAYMYRGENQVEDLIRSSRVNVFFVDDDQRIRPDDIGTVEEIERAAAKYGSDVMHITLEAQFRCSGAEGFLNWLDHSLQIRETANFDGWDRGAFEFEIYDDPADVLYKVKSKVEKGFKARVLAGFAWKWTAERYGNGRGQVCDVRIDEHGFEMPWNGRDISTRWAIDPKGVEQVGCIHTSQGREFDYVGVLMGNDLRFDPSRMKLYGSYADYYDTQGKKGLREKPDELTCLIKNIYKVLLSRGMRGCYLFCRDENLRNYLKDRLNCSR